MLKRIALAFKSAQQLGWRASAQYGVYQVGLRSGLLRVRTPAAADYQPLDFVPQPLTFDWCGPQTDVHQRDVLLATADRIVAGEALIFGRQWVNLDFAHSTQLKHWTNHKAVWLDGQDIKMTWEPGRFGWATVLARAYRLTGARQYAAAFWQHTETFMAANPPNQGPHWSSAQEVALRLIALAFADSLLAAAPESSPERRRWLAGVLAAHAARIPSTLAYARAQNNNHLLTEAAGLLTAAALLPQHRQAARWQRLGWREFNRGIARQIAPDGTYSQHSVNYHRLVLQTALWVQVLATVAGKTLPSTTITRLAAATRWLHTLLDADSGQVPNLGPNDGAYIFPLTEAPYNDYRPVLQAAGRAFLGEDLLPPGAWDQMADWLVVRPGALAPDTPSPAIHRLDGVNSWGYLRAVHFDSRPGHADQLHFDLWWHGQNIALDAGTYLYNAPPPWENALSGTDVHNTVAVYRRHQMTAVSRFLWLDWAQAKVLRHTAHEIQAEHDGYAPLGVNHRRTVTVSGDQWRVVDQISGPSGQDLQARLHWLLPDWPWTLEGDVLHMTAPHGVVRLTVSGPAEMQVSVARAGELLAGQADVPAQRGWVSPTYGEKLPALSLMVHAHSPVAIEFISSWDLA